MTRNTLPIFAAGLVFALAGALSAEVYNNQAGQYSIEVPNGWTAMPQGENVYVSSGKSAYALVLIITGGGAQPSRVAQVTDQFGQQWREYKRTNDGPVTLDGVGGRYAIYYGFNPIGVRAVVRAVSAPRGADAIVYIFSCPAQEGNQWMPVAQAMEASLRFNRDSHTRTNSEPPPPLESKAASKAAAAPANVTEVQPVLMFASWQDPSEGAFTVNVPRGWNIEGGTSRRAAVDIQHFVRASAKDNSARVFHGDVDIVPRQVPNAFLRREGQVIQGAWGGPLLVQRYRTGNEYAAEYIKTKLCPTPTIVKSNPDPTRSAALEREAAPYSSRYGFRLRATAGEVFYRCGSDYGYVSAVTMLVSSGQASMWFVTDLNGLVVKNGDDAPSATHVLKVMESSFKKDPEWERRSQMAADAQSQSVNQMQSAMANNLRQRAIEQSAQTSSSAVGRNKGFDVMEGWEARNKIRDGALDRGSDVRRGTITTYDPTHGERTISNNSNYYWTRPDGSVLGTYTDTVPKVDGGGWRMMQTK